MKKRRKPKHTSNHTFYTIRLRAHIEIYTKNTNIINKIYTMPKKMSADINCTGDSKRTHTHTPLTTKTDKQ